MKAQEEVVVRRTGSAAVSRPEAFRMRDVASEKTCRVSKTASSRATFREHGA